MNAVLAVLQLFLKGVIRFFSAAWFFLWLVVAMMAFVALFGANAINSNFFICLGISVFSFAMAMIPIIYEHRSKKQIRRKSSEQVRPVELDPALQGAKWKLLERVDGPERLAYYVGLYKTRVRHDSSPVTELDTCRFLRDAIIECREESIGAKSQIVNLMRQGNAHIEQLEGNHRELNARIESYSKENEAVPENLLSAKARLEVSLDQLRADYSALVQELKRLSEHFDQFESQIDFLNDTETDLVLLQRIDQNLGQTEHYRGGLPAGQMVQSWEIGQRFYALARQTEDALNGLAVNLAVKEPSVEGMEAMLAQIVTKTSRIQNPFPLS